MDRRILEDAHCWFAVDHVSGSPEVTAFKREARYRQAQWRQTQQLGLGGHRNSKRGIESGGPLVIASGSKLSPADGDRGRNFLSDAIRDAVKKRLDAPQEKQTFDQTRLKQDLLSSMPMCFNLFGEAASDPARARAVADLLMPGSVSGPVEVIFEWSPGRGSPQYTNDRTAFDAALLVGTPNAPRQVIGIETKYHEHALREPAPKPMQMARHANQTELYKRITNNSGVFKPGWEAHVLDTPLRQIWRDHLLVLAMIQRQDEWVGGRYVLVYPSRNSSFKSAAEAYQDLLTDSTTYCALTVEDLLDADVLHTASTGEAFRERYLW